MFIYETKWVKVYKREYGKGGYRYKRSTYGRILKNGESFIVWQPTQVGGGYMALSDMLGCSWMDNCKGFRKLSYIKYHCY